MAALIARKIAKASTAKKAAGYACLDFIGHRKAPVEDLSFLGCLQDGVYFLALALLKTVEVLTNVLQLPMIVLVEHQKP